MPGFGDRRVVEVSAGMHHNVAVCELGGVWTWGDAKLMNAGVHDGNGFVAQRVAALVSVRIRQACCGESQALAVTTDGALYAWGGNHRGELGVGTQGGDGSVENCHFAIGLPQSSRHSPEACPAGGCDLAQPRSHQLARYAGTLGTRRTRGQTGTRRTRRFLWKSSRPAVVEIPAGEQHCLRAHGGWENHPLGI